MPWASSGRSCRGPSHHSIITEDKSRILLIDPKDLIKGHCEVMVQYLRRFKENDRSVGVPLLTNPDAEIDGGHVGIEVRSNYETTPTAEGFERIDVKELPATLWNLAGSPVLFGYKYAVPPAPMKLALTRHEDLAVLVGNPLPEWPWPEEKCGPMEVRYIAGLYKLEEVGPLLRKQACKWAWTRRSAGWA